MPGSVKFTVPTFIKNVKFEFIPRLYRLPLIRFLGIAHLRNNDWKSLFTPSAHIIPLIIPPIILLNYHILRNSYYDLVDNIDFLPLMVPDDMDWNYILSTNYRLKLEAIGEEDSRHMIVVNGEAYTVGELSLLLHLSSIPNGINNREGFGDPLAVDAMMNLGRWVASGPTIFSDDDYYSYFNPSNYVDFLPDLDSGYISYYNLLNGNIESNFDVSSMFIFPTNAASSGSGVMNSMHNLYAENRDLYSDLPSLIINAMDMVDNSYHTLYDLFVDDKKWYHRDSIFSTSVLYPSYFLSQAVNYHGSFADKIMIDRLLIRHGLLY